MKPIFLEDIIVYGVSIDLMGRYAWYTANSLNRLNAVGTLRPNDLGLFDMHGSVGEWTQDMWGEQSGGDRPVTRDSKKPIDVPSKISRLWRGGSFLSLVTYVRSAFYHGGLPSVRVNDLGFRPVRTLIP